MVYNEYKRIYIDIYSKYMYMHKYKYMLQIQIQFTYPNHTIIHTLSLSHNPSLIHSSKYILKHPSISTLN